jgi:hypothetical protein
MMMKMSQQPTNEEAEAPLADDDDVGVGRSR